METRYISLDDAVQCANDLSVDLLNDGLDSASYGAQAVAEWLKDIPAAAVVEKTEWDKLMFLVDAANQILEAAKWISVDERLPELTEQTEGDDFLMDYSKPVLVRRFGRYTEIAAFARDGLDEFWVDEGLSKISGVTHWMTLPQPPKEGGGENE